MVGSNLENVTVGILGNWQKPVGKKAKAYLFPKQVTDNRQFLKNMKMVFEGKKKKIEEINEK